MSTVRPWTGVQCGLWSCVRVLKVETYFPAAGVAKESPMLLKDRLPQKDRAIAIFKGVMASPLGCIMVIVVFVFPVGTLGRSSTSWLDQKHGRLVCRSLTIKCRELNF
ncbi:hypothetical protein CPB83DRAFT_393710 [Crepidotus variabilis]|uniref:Uncharacterized protein n=1 Tax=Crepidotus variabilis TaxID=179855 RepID=A0A9P6JNZ1_9AGAR|nr:hypothetical protein CPB83DRAFT_393710 [Crepidotus variabilis]